MVVKIDLSPKVTWVIPSIAKIPSWNSSHPSSLKKEHWYWSPGSFFWTYKRYPSILGQICHTCPYLQMIDLYSMSQYGTFFWFFADMHNMVIEFPGVSIGLYEQTWPFLGVWEDMDVWAFVFYSHHVISEWSFLAILFENFTRISRKSKLYSL